MNKYTAALGCRSGGCAFRGYEADSFEAENDKDAISKAAEWARKHSYGVDSKTWLQVTTPEGKEIHSRHLGRY